MFKIKFTPRLVLRDPSPDALHRVERVVPVTEPDSANTFLGPGLFPTRLARRTRVPVLRSVQPFLFHHVAFGDALKKKPLHREVVPVEIERFVETESFVVRTRPLFPSRSFFRATRRRSRRVVAVTKRNDFGFFASAGLSPASGRPFDRHRTGRNRGRDDQTACWGFGFGFGVLLAEGDVFVRDVRSAARG